LRGDANEPLEVIGEVALVKKTDLLRDLGDAQISPQEQAFGALNASIEHISMRGHSCDLFERACEVISAHISNNRGHHCSDLSSMGLKPPDFVNLIG
jgi:hypothetical protein